MKKRLLSLLTGLAALSSPAQDIHIIPQPQMVKAGVGQFTLQAQTPIVAKGEALAAAHFLQGYLQEQYGLSLKIVSQERDNHGIHLRTGKKPAKNCGGLCAQREPCQHPPAR